MPRLTLRKSIDVAGRPEAVFAYLADIRRHMEWASLENRIGLTELQVEGTGSIGVGVRFRSIGREDSMVMHDESIVTVFEPPVTLGFDTTTRLEFFKMQYRHRYEVQATPGGTRVTYTVTAEPLNLPAWVLWPLVLLSATRAERLVAQGLARLQKAYEAHQSRQSTHATSANGRSDSPPPTRSIPATHAGS